MAPAKKAKKAKKTLRAIAPVVERTSEEEAMQNPLVNK
jgi:hypothetical protein